MNLMKHNEPLDASSGFPHSIQRAGWRDLVDAATMCALLAYPLWLIFGLAIDQMIVLDTSEAGAVEIIPTALLLVTSVVWLRAALTSPQLAAAELESSAHLYAVVAPLATVLFLLLFLRELSFGRIFGLDRGDANAIKAVAGLVSLGAAYASWRLIRSLGWPRLSLQELRRPVVMLTFLGGCALVLAQLYEKHIIPLPNYELMEEMSEFYASLLFLIAGWLGLRCLRSAASKP